MRWLALSIVLGAGCGGAQTSTSPVPQRSTAPAVSEKSSDPAAYAAVADAFSRKRPNVSQCFANAVASKELSETAHGRVKLALTVLPSGQPDNVRVAESSLGSKTVEDCVVALVQKWSLPPPALPLDFVFTYEFSNL
jgi:TonB family protein